MVKCDHKTIRRLFVLCYCLRPGIWLFGSFMLWPNARYAAMQEFNGHLLQFYYDFERKLLGRMSANRLHRPIKGSLKRLCSKFDHSRMLWLFFLSRVVIYTYLAAGYSCDRSYLLGTFTTQGYGVTCLHLEAMPFDAKYLPEHLRIQLLNEALVLVAEKEVWSACQAYA